MSHFGGTVLYRNDRCCRDSRRSSSVELSSGLKKQCQTDYKGNTSPTTNDFYSQKSKDKSTKDAQTYELKKTTDAKKVGTVVLSATPKRVHKPAHTMDECPYRRRCYQCKDLVYRIRNLLDEIKAIRKNDTTGTICDYCKRYSTQGKCRRCEYLQDRYRISENIDEVARQQRFKIWLCKVKQFLYTILERETCKHKVYTKTPATDELTNLLRELKSPLTIREPEIGYFPSIESLENITESKDILEQVLMRLKSEKRSEDFMFQATCKMDENVSEKELSVEEPVPPPSSIDKGTSSDMKMMKDGKKPKDSKDKLKFKESTENFFGKEKLSKYSKEGKKLPSSKGGKETKPFSSNDGNEKRPSSPKDGKEKKTSFPKEGKDKKPSSPKDGKDKKSSSPKDGKEMKPPSSSKEKKQKPPRDESPKIKTNAEEDLFNKMMKMSKEPKEPKQSKKQEKPPKVPIIGDLPLPKLKELKELGSVSGTVIECDDREGEVTEMVKGTKIVPIEPRKGLESGSVQPILFKASPECPEPKHGTPSTNTPSTAQAKKLPKTKLDGDDKQSGKGVIRYMLSNREFIEKGWTLLPTTKIMRRMNIYKMEPSNPEMDWFERNKTKRTLQYCSGELLAEIQENGSGKLYYKNGSLALEYYCPKDVTGFRYVVYSSGDNTDSGKKLPKTILAMFDYQGNAVVYDHYGNERLKYNQSEGMLFDDKIGPPGRWKWHTLNEPPVLQPVFADVHVRPNACLEQYFRTRKEKDDDKSDPSSKHKKEPNLDMLAIELENFLKEKAQALLQEFKPFQIRMKALKLNDQFSLKVLDQATIYLLFRDGQTSIKLNLGMSLISNEIIDTDTAEVTQVATPYDQRPPKSESIADIQIALEKARKLGKARGKLRN